MGEKSWGDVPLLKRQVYGAVRKVKKSVCFGCPFFKKPKGTSSFYGSSGKCLYFSEDADFIVSKKAKPSCF